MDAMTELKKPAYLTMFERYAANGEEGHQIKLFMWAALPETRAKYPELRWMFAIPNGGLRSKATAGKMKAMGLKAGVSDICLPVRRGEWPLLFIELKILKAHTGKAKPTKASHYQNEWLDHFKSQGYGAMVCVGWEHARDVIISYLEYNGE